jgi:hypothetical protein
MVMRLFLLLIVLTMDEQPHVRFAQFLLVDAIILVGPSHGFFNCKVRFVSNTDCRANLVNDIRRPLIQPSPTFSKCVI